MSALRSAAGTVRALHGAGAMGGVRAGKNMPWVPNISEFAASIYLSKRTCVHCDTTENQTGFMQVTAGVGCKSQRTKLVQLECEALRWVN